MLDCIKNDIWDIQSKINDVNNEISERSTSKKDFYSTKKDMRTKLQEYQDIINKKEVQYKCFVY